ncbi:MAG: DNA gyrase inhibitor YacG [Chromatiales bacterium]|nr:DNA gyrase inhibitor YacG [Chromatiales bacterium]
MLEVACPTCGKKIEWTPAQKWRPFCSERCKMIDLGEWLAEEKRHSRRAGNAARNPATNRGEPGPLGDHSPLRIGQRLASTTGPTGSARNPDP